MGSAAPRALVVATGGATGLALALACGANVFVCSDDDECSSGGEIGSCEASGYCSFPDADCESGSRYGGLAGDSLAGDCVPPDLATSGDDDVTGASGHDTVVLDDSGSDDVPTTDPTIDPTTVDGSTTDSTTGAPLPSCGDGSVDPDETCDDGNQIDGDGCNADCTPSGSLVWEIVEDGGAGLRDGAASIAIDTNDALYVGAWFTSDATPVLTARRLELDGTIAWSTPIVGAVPWSSVLAWGMAVGADGNPAIAADGSTDDGNEWVVAQLDSDGEILWQAIEPGEAYGLGIGDRVWACGRAPNGDGRLLGYDEDGMVLYRLEGEPYHPASGFAWDVVVTSGELFLAGTIEGSADSGFFRRITPAGDVVAELTLETTYDQALALAQGPDAWWFVGRSNPLDGGWIAATDASFAMFDGPTIETEDGSPGNLHGVAVGPSGEVVAVGWQTVGAAYDALVVKYDADGELAWSRTYAGTEDLADSARDVVIASDGTIVFAGHAGPLGATGDFWVAALTP